MNEIITYSIITLLLVAAELLYFKVADRFNIIDKPNQRSSHVTPTIRGGGIIFLFSLLLWFATDSFQYPWFIVGATLIAIVSFIDDIGEQSARVRLVIQLIAFLLMGWEAEVHHQALWISIVMLIIGVGTINAFNFMDGINGITGLYSLVNLVSLWVINRNVKVFTSEALIICTVLSVLIFLFFNFRKQARCFAGDVGSVTIAFIQLFMLIQLIKETQHYGWIFLFLIYGVDSILTIVYRLARKENIFKAHRMHLYQYFSNEMGISHRKVSILYGGLQLLVNILLYMFLLRTSFWFSLILMMVAGFSYLVIREIVLKRIGVKGLFLEQSK